MTSFSDGSFEQNSREIEKLKYNKYEYLSENSLISKKSYKQQNIKNV